MIKLSQGFYLELTYNLYTRNSPKIQMYRKRSKNNGGRRFEGKKTKRSLVFFFSFFQQFVTTSDLFLGYAASVNIHIVLVYRTFLAQLPIISSQLLKQI